MTPVEAMFQAVEQQMRPILMMTLSACIGLLPAAISTGIGSQVQRPLATVIVGGMLIGPIMLLVVVPALQTILPRLGRGGHRPRQRRTLFRTGPTLSFLATSCMIVPAICDR